MLSVNLRLTEFQNSFHDFQIELLEGNLYNNYSLTSDLLFYFYTFLYRHWNFDKCCNRRDYDF